VCPLYRVFVEHGKSVAEPSVGRRRNRHQARPKSHRPLKRLNRRLVPVVERARHAVQS